ncbi:MAG TPA: DUF2802 domain-containing protein [Halothiobacillaceae bacterium]|nr:DUF2802 domain-containing protein [Halothiobacillaceae bacterium]
MTEHFGLAGWLALVSFLMVIGLGIVTVIVYRNLLGAQTTRERWFQSQIERIDREQRALESALAGLGKHIDQVDSSTAEIAQQLKAQSERINARIEAVAAEDDQPGFSHALRLAAQGRVSVKELIDDFGMSESEARLLMQVNQRDRPLSR